MEENSARKEGEGAKDPNALGVNTLGVKALGVKALGLSTLGVNTRWRYCRAAHATIAP